MLMFAASEALSWTKPCPTPTWPVSLSTRPLSTVSPRPRFQIPTRSGSTCRRLTLGAPRENKDNPAAWTRFVNEKHLLTCGIQKSKHTTDACGCLLLLPAGTFSVSGQANVFYGQVAASESARRSCESRLRHTDVFVFGEIFDSVFRTKSYNGKTPGCRINNVFSV